MVDIKRNSFENQKRKKKVMLPWGDERENEKQKILGYPVCH